ncbi:hypothetical protein [Streptomyces sp. NPDC017673]
MRANEDTAGREEQVGGEQPLSRLDALRFARRVVEQQAVRGSWGS